MSTSFDQFITLAHILPPGKVYVYELRAMKTPKHVLEAHEGAVTSIAEQNSVKVLRTFILY